MTVLRSNSHRIGLPLAILLVGAGAVHAQEAASAGGAVQQEDVALDAGSADAAAAGAAPVAAEASAEQTDGSAEGKPFIQTLGEADQKIFLVDHDDGTWSMHVENVTTDNIVLLWRQAGGPEVTTKMPVDRPFTMSVHRLAPELIVERLFEGYGYTLHYDDAGRLESVRVYSPRESFAFKTPRLTESLGDWKKAETVPEAATGPPPQP